MKMAYGINIMLVALLLVGFVAGKSSVTIENNGYKKLLVVVDESVPENQQLVSAIKDSITKASEFLYKVTRQRAFFEEVSILIPQSWTPETEYVNIEWEDRDNRDIVVHHPTARWASNIPHVIGGSQKCGQPSGHLYMTDKFLLDNDLINQLGGIDKVLVHEWAHMRYGVFDEYPYPRSQQFYHDRNGDVQGIRCSASITGSFLSKSTKRKGCKRKKGNPLPGKDCVFDDDSNMATTHGSLMYKQYLPYVMEFCDNDTSNTATLHNYAAPTHQNNYCQGRSVWEVLREHEDFAGGVNPPSTNITSPKPRFRLVMKSDSRIVLVLDVSGSMGVTDCRSIINGTTVQCPTRITKLGQACSQFIQELLPDGVDLAIVWFNGTASKRVSLTRLSNSSRNTLLDHIPATAGGGTNIGAGVVAGLDILQENGGTSGGVLIVVSDGQDSGLTTTKRIQNSNTVIHTVAISSQAENKLTALGQATGGRSFIYTASDTSNALSEAFALLATDYTGTGNNSMRYTLKSEAYSLSTSTPVSDAFIIDKTVGPGTSFRFDYSGNADEIDIELESPGGNKLYTKNSSIVSHDQRFGVFRFSIPGIAEKGEWSFSITTSGISGQNVAVTVTSTADGAADAPIIARPFWDTQTLSVSQHFNNKEPQTQALYVMVSQSTAPVLYARVMATIDIPTKSKSSSLRVYDNGVGADTFRDDGVYSAYFTQITGDGRYNVKVKVDGTSSTVVSPRRIIGKAAATDLTVEDNSIEDQQTGQFSRVSSGGAFAVDGYKAGYTLSYRPSRIADLAVTEVDYENRNVTLQWTATGDMLDAGSAKAYDLRYSTSLKDFREDFDSGQSVREATEMKPKESREEEHLSFVIPGSDTLTYILALRVKGTHGWSEPSNLAYISMNAQPLYYGEPVQDSVSPPSEPVENSLSPPTGLTPTIIALIACGGVLVVLLLGVGVAYIVWKVATKPPKPDIKLAKRRLKKKKDLIPMYA